MILTRENPATTPQPLEQLSLKVGVGQHLHFVDVGIHNLVLLFIFIEESIPIDMRDWRLVDG